MVNIVVSLLDILFPPRDTTRLIQNVTEKECIALLLPQTTHHVTYLLPYNNPLVRALIKENKFHQHTRAANLLAAVLKEYLTNTYPDNVLIPVPLGKVRRRKRGYNQVTEVLHHIPNAKIDETILCRTLNTLPQTDLPRKERLINMRNAFAINPAQLSKYKNTTFVVIDDVLTTGTTMSAAKAALIPHLRSSCTLVCVALAH